MSSPFIALPDVSTFVLSNSSIPSVVLGQTPLPTVEGLTSADIVIANGLISGILPPGAGPADLPSADMRGGQIWPCFVDMHTHLDKGHIWPRIPDPDGTFDRALETVQIDRETNWSASDVAARTEFSLRSAYAHGTKLIRTHLDSAPPQHRISFDVFSRMREAWKERIELQAVALFPLDLIGDQAYFSDLIGIVRDHGCILGGVTDPSLPELDWHLDQLFRAAAENDLDIDLHADERRTRMRKPLAPLLAPHCATVFPAA
jgi:cytosine deaminase